MRNQPLKRQIAISDIHGCYALLRDLIENEIKFNPKEDQLIFVGDSFDRGKESKKVVEYLKRLKETYPEQIVLLMGNHEHLCFHALSDIQIPFYFNDPMGLWLANGGRATIESFGGLENCSKELLPFIEQLKLSYETETHIFVHGGIPFGMTLESASPLELLWDRGLRNSGQSKTVIVGHCCHPNVTFYKNLVAIDTGAAFRGKLSAYDVLNDRVYEAIKKPMHEGLPPALFGRN